MDEIRAALAADEVAVVALWHSCGLVRAHNDPGADFRFALAGPSATVLVGIEGAALVSSAMVGHDGHRGWLYHLGCAPAHRRRGIGRRTVRAAEDWLRRRGIGKLQLLVREDNATVVPFYERLGFAVEPRVVMSRRLD